jgi:hypothetical protein
MVALMTSWAVRAGGIPPLIMAMTRHPDKPAVQDTICRAIGNIAANNSMHCRRAVHLPFRPQLTGGGTVLIVQCFSRYR